MPRPNPAQIAYGSLTVVLTTVVLLLLTRTESGVGVVCVACGALAAGLLAAALVPAPRRRAAPLAPVRPRSADRPLATATSRD
ncbi:hypothetical protein JJV70_13945 [Streptomyces sp. JJ66]|uniref:hypothetical protein n=1 Tax=Streptomyces sp. JJ66 TaxID=2803843 RepID=UPI001C59BB15|nr:hypothetical protein [Streptomyces sp. JJ66]MBW1603186.1 hypothetical protein [Streptomyces sp. JJ66]